MRSSAVASRAAPRSARAAAEGSRAAISWTAIAALPRDVLSSASRARSASSRSLALPARRASSPRSAVSSPGVRVATSISLVSNSNWAMSRSRSRLSVARAPAWRRTSRSSRTTAATASRSVPSPANWSKTASWTAGRRTANCSDWPWISMQANASSRNASSEAGSPLMRTVERPESAMERSTTTRPSGRDSTASTTARSAPVAITSRPRRPPKTKTSASTTSDLPEPVSPVKTLRPGPGSMTTERATAKSVMESRSSTLGDSARHLKFELFRQLRVKGGWLTEAHEAGQVFAWPDGDSCPAGQRKVLLAVDAQDRSTVGRDLEFDDGFRLHDEGAAHREVGRDGGQDEVVLGGRKDRSAGAQRVARAACGRRHDDAIAAVVGEAGAIYLDVDVDRASGRLAAYDNVVEAMVNRRSVVLAKVQFAPDHKPFFDAPIFFENPFNIGEAVTGAHICEETEAAHVHAKDGEGVGNRQAGGAQHGAIPTDANDESCAVHGRCIDGTPGVANEGADAMAAEFARKLVREHSGTFALGMMEDDGAAQHDSKSADPGTSAGVFRCTRYSTLPSPPRIGDAIMPQTAQPASFAHSLNSSRTIAWTAG